MKSQSNSTNHISVPGGSEQMYKIGNLYRIISSKHSSSYKKFQDYHKNKTLKKAAKLQKRWCVLIKEITK